MSTKQAKQEALRNWFSSRGAIDKSKFETEAGLPFRALRDFLNYKRGFTEANMALALRRAQHYGLRVEDIEKEAIELVKEARKEIV